MACTLSPDPMRWQRFHQGWTALTGETATTVLSMKGTLGCVECARNHTTTPSRGGRHERVDTQRPPHVLRGIRPHGRGFPFTGDPHEFGLKRKDGEVKKTRKGFVSIHLVHRLQPRSKTIGGRLQCIQCYPSVKSTTYT